MKFTSFKSYQQNPLTIISVFSFGASSTGRENFFRCCFVVAGRPHPYAEVELGKCFLKHQLNLSASTFDSPDSSRCGIACFGVGLEQLRAKKQLLQRGGTSPIRF